MARRSGRQAEIGTLGRVIRKHTRWLLEHRHDLRLVLCRPRPEKWLPRNSRGHRLIQSPALRSCLGRHASQLQLRASVVKLPAGQVCCRVTPKGVRFLKEFFMAFNDGARLLADIGSTYARFALEIERGKFERLSKIGRASCRERVLR